MISRHTARMVAARSFGLAAILLALLCLSGCQEDQFGFASGRKFSIPRDQVSGRAAQCFDALAAEDARVHPDFDARDDVSRRGDLSEAAFRRHQRERQRSWDKRYCRRQADCRSLADPAVPPGEIADSVDLCMAHRAQRRVAMGL